MFGMFKKKRKDAALPPEWNDARSGMDQNVHQQMQRAAKMLQMQLIICTSVEDFDLKAQSKFFRGYLVGFFDSALQWANIPVNSDEQLISFISLGHGYLARPMEMSSPMFNGDSNKAIEFCFDSMAMQADPEFSAAQRQGGEEFYNFVSGQGHPPNGLMNYFHAPTSTMTPDDAGKNKRKITFNLHNGRSVSVEQFQHSDTYASLLEGKPNEFINNRIIERSLKAASKHDSDKPFLIPPKTHQDSRGGVRIPPVCCVAQLMSTPMSSQMHGSALSVVWFSDPFFDEPLAIFTERSLRDIPWEQVARDFEF